MPGNNQRLVLRRPREPYPFGCILVKARTLLTCGYLDLFTREIYTTYLVYAVWGYGLLLY